MMKWLLRIVIALVVLGVAAFLAGSLLPQDHTASRTSRLSAPPERVWDMITNVSAFPSWRPDVKSVAVLPPEDGKSSWRESSKQGNNLTYVADTSEPPHHFVTRIADKGIPFGGTWDFAISPDGTGSRITITENGEIYNPIFRLVSRVMGHTATIDAYMAALATGLGDKYAPAG